MANLEISFRGKIITNGARIEGIQKSKYLTIVWDPVDDITDYILKIENIAAGEICLHRAVPEGAGEDYDTIPEVEVYGTGDYMVSLYAKDERQPRRTSFFSIGKDEGRRRSPCRPHGGRRWCEKLADKRTSIKN